MRRFEAMKIRFTMLISIFFVQLIEIKSIQAQATIVNLPKNLGMNCNEATNAVKADLITRGYFSPWTYNPSSRPYKIQPKIQFSSNYISENYYDYPSDRKATVIIRTAGDPKKLDTLFRSSKFIANISAKIIASCPKVGLVEFPGYWEGIIPVGYFPDGTVRLFKYLGRSNENSKIIETPQGSRMLFKWGYYTSS